MSLQAFHKVFIAASTAALGLTAYWALGHNAAGLRTPWLACASLSSVALLAIYAVWKFKKA